MANAVLMPKAGISVESCIITQWQKEPGDAVAVGDILFSYETDKASFECESTEAGTLLARFFENGDEVPVLVNVCAIGSPGEDVSALRPGGAPAEPEEVKAIQPQADAPVVQQPAVQAQSADGFVKISPRARHLAESHGVDVRMAAASGPYGRVVEKDVRALMASGSAATSAAYGGVGAAEPGAYTGTGIGGRISVGDLSAPAAAPVADADGYIDVAFSNIRKVIAASMTQSLATIPQLTHNFSFNAAEIMAYRKKLKEADSDASGITLGDMVMYAVSRMLPKYPQLNAHMVGESTLRQFEDVHLGFACDTERGLMVPVVRSANRKSLLEISREVKALAKQAHTGSLSPDAMTGGTFTVSNLGALAVESFTPVINPPQTGILGVDTIVERPYYGKKGKVKLYPAMGLSLTYDHRAIDGAPASRFVKELCGMLEQFTVMLAQ